MAKKALNTETLSNVEILSITEILRELKPFNLSKDSLFGLLDLSRKMNERAKNYYQSLEEMMKENKVNRTATGQFDLSELNEEQVEGVNKQVQDLQLQKTDVETKQSILSKEEFKAIITENMTLGIVDSLEQFLVK